MSTKPRDCFRDVREVYQSPSEALQHQFDLLLCSQLLHSIMSLIRKLLTLPFSPSITVPLLVALTYGPANVREPALQFLSQYLSPSNIERLITSLKVLAAGGLLKRLNARLNQWALNNWKWSADTHKWKWPREVAVVTGGCSGIGLHMVKQLQQKGVRVAVFDIQPLPKEFESCKPLDTGFKCSG